MKISSCVGVIYSSMVAVNRLKFATKAEVRT